MLLTQLLLKLNRTMSFSQCLFFLCSQCLHSKKRIHLTLGPIDFQTSSVYRFTVHRNRLFGVHWTCCGYILVSNGIWMEAVSLMQPLADARKYTKGAVSKILEQHGARIEVYLWILCGVHISYCWSILVLLFISFTVYFSNARAAYM